MKYFIVSDIHANLESLETVLADYNPHDRILCLGDTIGYGPDPNACVARMRELGATCVLGNHDVAAIDDFGTAYFNSQAQHAIRWTQGVLKPEHRAWLDGLSYELRLPEFLLVHGAPVRYFEYCKTVETARRAFQQTDAPLIFIGHTHIAEYYSLEEDGRVENVHMQHGGELKLDPAKRYIINPGSVGQPRDLNPAASYAVFSPHDRTVTWQRREYDVDTVIAKMAEAGLPAPLGQRLVQGR